jgi:hypothetical protein
MDGSGQKMYSLVVRVSGSFYEAHDSPDTSLNNNNVDTDDAGSTTGERFCCL